MTWTLSKRCWNACAPGAICLALCLVSACQSTPHAIDKKNAERRWSEVRGKVKHQLAVQQYEGGLFQEACDTVTEALALDPTRTDSYVLLARCSLELNKPASAQQAIQLAHHAGLQSPALNYLQGVLYEQRNEPDEATAQYEIAHAGDPAQLDYLIAYVESLAAGEKTERARTVLREGAAQVDDDGSIAVLSAYLAMLAGKTEEATAHLQAASALATKNDVVALDLGRLLTRGGRYAEAIAVLQPLLDEPGEVPMEGTLRRVLAECHLNQGDARAAKEALADYAPFHVEDVAAQVLLAKASIADGDMITALTAVTAAEKLHAQDSEVRLIRAILLWKRGDLKTAESMLRELVRASPTDADLRCLLAEVLLDKNDTDAARASLQQALRIDPNLEWANAALARLGQSS